MRLAVITPSYGRDWPLFRVLHESVLRHTPESACHYVIVPGSDVPLFSRVAGPRCVILPEEGLYSRHYRPAGMINGMVRRLPRVPAHARIAAVDLRRPLRPIRGWIMQQALKMEACRRAEAEVVLLLDSDVALIRPVTAGSLSQDGRPRFYRRPGAVDGNLPLHVKWHATSRKLLGLPPAALPAPDYVSSFVIWDPDILRRLLARIEQVTGRHWMDAVTAQASFSEWTLYGVFVDELVADAAALGTDVSLCHSYWGCAPLTAGGAADFAAHRGPQDVAVHIQSKSGTPMSVRRDALRLLDAAGR
jgi:hypothetical protein